MKLNISKKVFNKIYLERQIENQNRYQIYYGGSSSGKSYSLAQRTVLDVMKGRNYLIVRNVQNTIRRSCFNEIMKAISSFKLSEYFQVNKSELVITCTLNNKQILFAGLDDPEKIKSITPIDGVITDVWVEEATECDYKAVKQLDKRLRGRSKFKKRLTLSFNPILQDHWLYTEYFGIWDDSKQFIAKDDVSILKTTYKDNRFLTQDDIDALENETDQYYYEVYTLGNWGVLGAVIFKNWRVEDLSEVKKTFDKIRHGLDFGFADDPNALADIHYDKSRKRLFIFGEEYAADLTNDEIAEMVKPHVGFRVVTCDSSEPKTIKELQLRKINAIGAKKGPGSVEAGIRFLQGLEIIICTSCPNVKMEFSKYKWREDKNGNVLPVPIDKDNHLIDAIRYALEDEIGTTKLRVGKKSALGLR
ncbi:PBSX family phage terminase large subunit [Paenibacillus apiarius]|uniref:PBSX family phage terminase large subunit n=1 Tax=Paenibacillus apiarius TaxID=46240 RepID=A0ABT4DR60_9BACL|nr:PBSX family phage terminase large subunit [Paenibacillus apiarius]MCY9513303.1 PBSX family phage terminase large subunit [Paenibacillus apiarius]MCY9519725.1 PBSX family phage terminase large subunit [Paenibacillus apiarius]MCY9553219.1 PBSX family phage terminase large subunit [Paenibacillus apiarius]MCY9557069.1 PBSX family phage terminase large subunit [Paenibacillus apiarius]MCY9682190.1 PBSX family phage terminase large subunit [Paenibacillus apiarius]